MTSAAGFSRTPPGTAAAATTRSTGSGTSSAPARSTSPKGSKHGCTAFTAREEHVEVEVAYRCAQQVRACFHQDSHAAGRRLAETVLTSLPTCPIPEVARLGRTLKQWRAAFLGYFDTDGASNGGTEAVNGLIELHRRIARGFRNRNNY